MIIELYPNEEKFEFEHGDDHVLWVKISNEQYEKFKAFDWLICCEVDSNVHPDYDISKEGLYGLFRIVNMMLENLQGEVQV